MRRDIPNATARKLIDNQSILAADIRVLYAAFNELVAQLTPVIGAEGAQKVVDAYNAEIESIRTANDKTNSRTKEVTDYLEGRKP